MIRSRNVMENIVHVREVLTSLTEHGLTTKHAKCAWACQQVDICGYDIYKDSIPAQEHTTHAVMDWPQPENSKDIRGFLGLNSYYRKFIEHYVRIAIALNAIHTPPNGTGDIRRWCGEPRMIRRTPFACDRKCQHEFNTLKMALGNVPVLALPDPEAEYCLHLNPSQYALGAVLP